MGGLPIHFNCIPPVRHQCRSIYGVLLALVQMEREISVHVRNKPLSQFIFINIACATCFFLDFRTGVLGGGYVLAAVAAASILRAYLKRSTIRQWLITGGAITFWLVCIFVSGHLSNGFARTERAMIIREARKFHEVSGDYPKSLRLLPEYASKIDSRAHLRVGSSELFIADGGVYYKEFPGRWVRFDLNSSIEVVRDFF